MNIGVSYKKLNENNATVLNAGISQIADELEFLLNMPKHSLFFGNGMGVDLEKYLHLTNRNATFNLIKEDIVDTLRKYNKVTLKSLEIIFNKDSTLVINLTVTINSTGELLTMPMVLQTV